MMLNRVSTQTTQILQWFFTFDFSLNRQNIPRLATQGIGLIISAYLAHKFLTSRYCRPLFAPMKNSIHNFVGKVFGFTAEIKQIKDEKEKFGKANVDFDTEITALNADIAESKGKIQLLEQLLEESKKKIENLETQRKQSQERTETDFKNYEKLYGLWEHLNEENGKLIKEKEKLIKENNELTKKNIDLKQINENAIRNFMDNSLKKNS
ncbi:MAG: hypothetical protein L0207_03470 [Chlamydiae bacterium]|nr:hypothetical protein [Chlamydiota bacterium]